MDQSRLFAAGGINPSTDVPAPEALAPLLRDAISTAVTRRTCVHLAIPVDVQAAPSPIQSEFCAANANLRIAPTHVDPETLDAVAKHLPALRGAGGFRRIVIAAGLRAVGAGRAITRLAEMLHAPIIYRLDAKGVVDETHPLAFGVVGVHGKPGLEAAASIISTSELVLSLGVDDNTLLLCNLAGLQIRPMIEFEPDACAVVTRYKADFTVIGNIGDACDGLADRLATMLPQHGEPGEPGEQGEQGEPHDLSQLAPPGPLKREESSPDALWGLLHGGSWRKLLDFKG